jgi:hypothetical protein
MTRFHSLDAVPAPDQWPEILDRAAAPPSLATDAGTPRPGPGRWLAAAAMVAVAAVTAAALALHDGRGTPPSEGTDGPDAVPDDGALVTCADGRLLAGAVPPDAESRVSASVDSASARNLPFSWVQDGLGVELLVPGIQYVDFVGEETEEVDDPDGFFYFPTGSQETRFLGQTGLAGGCGSYELTVTGGVDVAARRRLLLELAHSLRWERTPDAYDAIGDCGPAGANVAVGSLRGPTLAAAFADQPTPWTLLGLHLEPELQTVLRPAGGRCTALVTTTGGLPLRVVLTGSGGTFGIESVSSLPLGGPDLLVQPVGRRVTVHLDHWCYDCTRATVEVEVPGQDLSGSAAITGNTEVQVELPGEPGPGPICVELRYYAGDELRDVVTAVVDPT